MSLSDSDSDFLDDLRCGREPTAGERCFECVEWRGCAFVESRLLGEVAVVFARFAGWTLRALRALRGVCCFGGILIVSEAECDGSRFVAVKWECRGVFVHFHKSDCYFSPDSFTTTKTTARLLREKKLLRDCTDACNRLYGSEVHLPVICIAHCANCRRSFAGQTKNC